MLARNAEALYWIGRYVERADDTARILDVTVHQLLEDSSVDPDHTSRVLLQVLGIEAPDTELDVWSLTDLVAFRHNPPGGGCSIVDAISAARENARSAREVTSTETWECLNTTFNALGERERAAKRLGPHEFLSFIEGRAAMFAGLADSTLSRDDGYRFMVLGRAIERVDMTVRMLLSRVGDSAVSPAWVTVLRSAGAHDTYLRTYRGVLDANRVVEFILLDRLFPRSIFYSLKMAEHSLDELLHSRHSRVGAISEAQRLLGRARSELEFVRPGVLLESLEMRLAGLQQIVFRRRRSVGGCSTFTLYRGLPGLMPASAIRCRPSRGRTDVASARAACDRLCVPVAGDGLLQRSPAHAEIGLPAERRPQPGRNRPATRSYRYVDYWGTAVTAFDLHAPHTELTVTSASVVETEQPDPLTEELTWSDCARGGDRSLRRGAASDRLHAGEQTHCGRGQADRQGTRPADAVIAAAEWVRSELDYVKGSTGVHSSGLDALREGKGVCQDFVHLSLMVLRSMGIPARYVSGYHHPDAERSDR